MGVLDLLTGRTHRFLSSTTLPLASVYQPSTLPELVIHDLITDDLAKLPLTRNDAIQIPAVSKARNLLISTIAKLPLRALRVDEQGNETDVTRSLPWLYRTNGSVSPYERMAWTLDDLIFYGYSLWLLDRGAPVQSDGGRRPILNAEWCPKTTWSIQNIEGKPRVVVDDIPIADDRYMLLNSPFEGLLTVGQRTIRGARDVEDAWVGRARNPIPATELHQLDDTLEEEQVKPFVEAWAKARTSANGAIGYTPPSIEVRTHGEVKAELMVEGRNAIRTDVGSFLNIRTAMLDGTIGVDSLTYTTKDGERNSFYEFDTPFWTDPITARMSLDDIVPRGTRIRFDLGETQNIPTPTGARVED